MPFFLNFNTLDTFPYHLRCTALGRHEKGSWPYPVFCLFLQMLLQRFLLKHSISKFEIDQCCKVWFRNKPAKLSKIPIRFSQSKEQEARSDQNLIDVQIKIHLVIRNVKRIEFLYRYFRLLISNNLFLFY